MTAPSPERARLSAALRELKAHTGLSLAGLAAKTAFSKSSWDRYLNGRTLPPRDAVQELCRIAGRPEGRCLALWEIAESEGSGRSGPAAQGTPSVSPTASLAKGSASPATGSSSPPRPTATPSPTPTPGPTPAPAPAPAPAPREATHTGGGALAGNSGADDTAVHRGAAAVAVLASVCAVAVGGVAAVALLLPHGDGEPRSSLTPAPAATGPRCRGAVCEDKSPMQMICAAGPATLAARRTAGGAWIELRYSEECEASWARMWQTRVGDRIEMTADGRDGRTGGPRSAQVRNAVDAEAYVYTPMTATRPGTVVRACFLPAAGGEGDCVEARVGE